jgi:5-methylcytosine-specific restriction enzyme A
LRPCPRCQRPSLGRCPYCREQRPSARARGYSPAWDRYSKDWLARFPFCGMRGDGRFHADESLCVQQGRRERATVTDHIVPLASGGALFDPANHQSLCTSCNTRKAV